MEWRKLSPFFHLTHLLSYRSYTELEVLMTNASFPQYFSSISGENSNRQLHLIFNVTVPPQNYEGVEEQKTSPNDMARRQLYSQKQSPLEPSVFNFKKRPFPFFLIKFSPKKFQKEANVIGSGRANKMDVKSITASFSFNTVLQVQAVPELRTSNLQITCAGCL